MNSAGFEGAIKQLAMLRAFTDLPYASEIALEAGVFDVAPRAEQRFKSITALILKRGTKQILEVGAGLSTRGLTMTADDSLTYLETDLPENIIAKEQVVRSILRRSRMSRSNLLFAGVDVQLYYELSTAAEQLRSDITIVTEGVLIYKTRSVQRTIAGNIHRLLRERGGVWITPDFATVKERERSYGKKRVAPFAAPRGSLVRQGSFKNQPEISRFLKSIGFEAEVYLQSDFVTKLTCVDSLKLRGRRGLLPLSPRRIYCLRPR